VLPAPTLLLSRSDPHRDGLDVRGEWDGFRALVSTVDGLRVGSRLGWKITRLVPELRSLPAGLVLAGELVAFENGVPTSRC
jgi:ATP-dependent DNA ligase